MAEGKKSFIVYSDWKKYIDDLTDAQIGKWTRWMFDYCNDKWENKEIEYPKDITVKMLCIMTKDTLKRDLMKYKAKKQRIDEINERRRNKVETKSDEKQHEIDNDIVHEIDKCNMLYDKCNMLNEVSKDTIKESVKEKSTTSRFIPPTLEQVQAYCLERNNLVDPNKWFDFYQAKGWMVGKNKMKDWKAAVRTWEKESGFKSNPNEPNDNGGFTEI